MEELVINTRDDSHHRWRTRNARGSWVCYIYKSESEILIPQSKVNRLTDTNEHRPLLREPRHRLVVDEMVGSAKFSIHFE